MVNPILDQILQLATQKADDVEVYYLSSQNTPIEFENNRLKSLQTKARQGVALRLIHQGKLGFASSTDLTRLEDLVEAALQTSEIGAPADFEFAADVHLSSPASAFIPPATQELVEIGKNLIEQVLNYNPEILVSVGFNISRQQIQIATNQDVYAERSSQLFSASLSGNLVRGEDFLEIACYDVASDRPLQTDRLLQDLIRKYSLAEQKATIQSGTFPIFFTPQAVARIFGGLFRTILSGQTIVQKSSPLLDKIGETLFDSRLSLYEDPNFGPSACSFDDEGTPTTVKRFIDHGTINQFYWDRQWGSRGQISSTGNGFRGGLSRPSPSLVNLCLEPGQTSTEDLIASIDEGLIVDQVLGAGQSNQLAGEFSVNLDLGYKVEQGKIVGRVKNTMVAGNIFEAFKQLVDLGNQPEWVGSSSYVPSLLFQQLGVAAKH
ncbi:putative protein MJ0231 [Planktothrix tepida]|uniref:TldD/PmbA family protein n=1 Tax=Planktothrix tepida PCC 9214 TaxID=671072 RepID=A0A1J1LJZ8_9CYAN|nr:TldD/PmbA family protein [Planktothrix tepida]CAD5945838.1 putative protein MJ0231 [Planktothrix tepida]CUR32807.1 conserved hypothetical protein [Planktothrix tepida PCC 9214]